MENIGDPVAIAISDDRCLGKNGEHQYYFHKRTHGKGRQMDKTTTLGSFCDGFDSLTNAKTHPHVYHLL